MLLLEVLYDVAAFCALFVAVVTAPQTQLTPTSFGTCTGGGGGVGGWEDGMSVGEGRMNERGIRWMEAGVW